MKQTNNAIKFLMAQYRAIFKNANIAMVAAMAAAALAAGQAQAAPINLGASADQATPSIEVTTADATANATGGFVDELTIASGGTLTFDGSKTANTGHIKVGNTLTVQSGGSLVVKGSGAAVDASTGSGVGIIGTYDKSESYDDKNSTLNVDGGSVTVSASQIQMNNVVLNNANVTVEKNIADVGGKDSDFSDNAQINAVKGALGGGVFTVKGENSNIKLNSGSIFNAHTFNLEDGQITMTSTDQSGEAAIIRAFGGGVVNLKGTDITTAGSGNYIGGEGGVNMSAGNVTVAANSVLNISGKLDKSGNLADAQKAGEINVTGGKITVANDGLLKLNGNATFADGTVANSGTIEAVTGSKINVANTTGLYSASGKLKLTGATLNFTGAALDLSDTAANISGDASSTVLAEKANVTIGNGYKDKVSTLVAGTLTVKGEVSAAPDQSFKNRPFLVIDSGDVTALNEVKGSPKNTEIAVYNKTSGGSATLTLGNADTTNGKLTDIARVYVGVGQDGKDSTNTLNVNGKWDFANAKLAVGNNGTLNINEGAEVSNIERLQIHGNQVAAKNTVNVDGTLKIQRLLAAESQTTGGDEINVKGTFEIHGDGKTETANASGNYANDVQLTKATLNIKAGGTVSLATKDAWDDVLKVTTASDTGITTFEVQATGGNTTDFGGWDKSKVKINAGGTLRIDLSGYKVADKTALDTLVDALKATDSKGLIDFGGFSIGKVEIEDDGTIDLGNMPTAKTEATQNLEVNLGNTTSIDKSYSMGSANVSGNSLTIGTGSTVEFNNAKNGQFATNKDAAAAADSKVNVTLAANSAVNLNGNGSLGDIKKSGSVAGTAVVLGGNNGTQKVGVVDVESFNQVGGNVTTTGAITATGATTVSGVLNAGGDVSTKTLELSSGAIKAGDNSITVTDTSKPAKIFGDVEASSLSLSGGALIAGGADVKLDSLNGATGTAIQVGEDTEGGLGATVTTTNLVLGGGSIFVDPEFGKPAGFVVTENLKTTGSAASGAGTLDGMAYVGKNAALGIGFANTDAGLAELKALVAPYLVDNGGFAESGVKNALVINDSITVENDKGIAVDATLTSANYNNTPPTNAIKLGAGAALVVTDKALDEGAKAAVTFSNANGTASITADQTSKVVLVGDFTAADKGKQIFAAVNSGNNNAGTVTGDVAVEAAGGLLEGKISNGSIASLELNKDAEKAIRSEVSAPVGQLFVDFANGKFDGATGAGYDFLATTISAKGSRQSTLLLMQLPTLVLSKLL